MAFNVETFKSNIAKNGLIQTNKYDINMSFGLNEQGQQQNFILNTINNTNITFNDIVKDLSFRCTNAVLPGVALRTVDSNRYGLGVIEKMPYTGNYTDITLTFLCDRFGLTYNFWYSWINYIFSVNGHDSPNPVMGAQRPYYTTEYKDNYSTIFNITVYDQAGNKSLVYTLYKAYPISINDTSIGWGDNNDLLKLTTTLTFREWSFEGTRLSSGAGSGSQGNPGGNTSLQI